MIRSARGAFCLTPVGMMQFNDVLQNLKRGKQTKELWQRISLEMATFSPWAAHSGRQNLLGVSLGREVPSSLQHSYCHCTELTTLMCDFVRAIAPCSQDSVKCTQAVQSTPIPQFTDLLLFFVFVHQSVVKRPGHLPALPGWCFIIVYRYVNMEFQCTPSFLHFSST